MTPTSRSGAKSKGPGADGALERALQASPLAFVVSDGRQILRWNAGAEALLGWKAAEMLNQPLSRIFAEDGPPGLEASGLARTDVSLRRKDGETVNAEIWSSTLPGGSSSQTGGQVLLLQDVTERKFLENALLEAAEREQRRIGQELHDHLCQHLLGAAFAAKALAGALDRENSHHAAQLHDLARLINDAVSQVRDISRGLHPVEFDAAGLMSALQELANRAGAMAKCTFRCERNVFVKNTTDALNAYRIAQAAVASALQQTGARHIEIALFPSGDSVCLQISDDGEKEGELTSNPAGIAARTLHYRARAMRGSLSLDFQPRKGTHVTCLFPS